MRSRCIRACCSGDSVLPYVSRSCQSISVVSPLSCLRRVVGAPRGSAIDRSLFQYEATCFTNEIPSIRILDDISRPTLRANELFDSLFRDRFTRPPFGGFLLFCGVGFLHQVHSPMPIATGITRTKLDRSSHSIGKNAVELTISECRSAWSVWSIVEKPTTAQAVRERESERPPSRLRCPEGFLRLRRDRGSQ